MSFAYFVVFYCGGTTNVSAGVAGGSFDAYAKFVSKLNFRVGAK